MTKQTTTLTIPTELLVRIIDNEVDARKDAWEISWKLCRIFPGLNDASSVAEFLLKRLMDKGQETEEGVAPKEPTTYELIEIVKKIYEIIE